MTFALMQINQKKRENSETMCHLRSLTSFQLYSILLKDTVTQIEKALINDRLRVSKVSSKFLIPTIYNFSIIYP